MVKRQNLVGDTASMTHKSFLSSILMLVVAAIVSVSRPGSGIVRGEQAQRRVAITVDDLPGAIEATPTANGDLHELERYNEAIPAILKAHHAPAIGFVNEKRLQVAGERDGRAALLQRWIDAGFELGNHTYSHANFNQVSLQERSDYAVAVESCGQAGALFPASVPFHGADRGVQGSIRGVFEKPGL
jgi:peptidoglycan/xylan/chitin deacetylase (PgdA/CDA1 family)